MREVQNVTDREKVASRGLDRHYHVHKRRKKKKGFMNKYPHVNRWIRLVQWFQARGGKGAGRGVGALTWQKLQELE